MLDHCHCSSDNMFHAWGKCLNAHTCMLLFPFEESAERAWSLSGVSFPVLLKSHKNIHSVFPQKQEPQEYPLGFPAKAAVNGKMHFREYRCRFLPVDSVQACVHSGKEVSGTLLAVKISGSTAGGW